jgi:cytoskeletal protein RodZ
LELDNSILGLATIRRNRSVSLEQISASTKISVRLLKAIECGEFKKLPGGIYNTNYIRQYARAIDFDESELLAYYHSAMGTASNAQVAGRTKGNDSDSIGGLRTASILR